MAGEKVYKSKHQDPDYKGEPADAELQKGPVENRSCTDCLCCILFALFVIGMVAAGIIGFAHGNPKQLAAPYDADGNQCGLGNFKDYKYLYFANPFPGYLNHTVCVKTCPKYSSSSNYPSEVSCMTNSIVQSCSNAFTSENSFIDFVKKVIKKEAQPDKTSLYVYNTTTFVERFCIPSMEYFQYFSSVANSTMAGDTIEKWVSDIEVAWPIILASLGFAFVFGLIYLVFVRYCSGVLVWFSILALIAAFGGIGYYLFNYAQKLKDQYAATTSQSGTSSNNNSDTITTLRVFAYILWGLAGLTFLIVCCLYRKIRLAIGIIKTAADYVKDTWTAILVPIVMIIILAGLYIYWVAAAIYLYSWGDFSKRSGTPFGQVKWSTNTKRLLVYHLFGGLWLNAYVIATSQFVLASSTALWYFGVQYGKAHGTVRRGVWRAFRYHIGSIAFGAFILALIQFIRIVWAYIQNKLKPYENNTGGCLIKYAVWYIACCLACFERYIRFLNKNAYIQIALEGKNFLASAISAFYLILRNGMMFVIVGGLGEIFIGLGKWLIAIITGGVGYIVLTRAEYFSEKMYSAILPAFIMFCLAYAVGALLMSVYGMAADTILQCYILTKDLQANHNIDIKPPTALQDFIENHPIVKKHDMKH